MMKDIEETAAVKVQSKYIIEKSELSNKFLNISKNFASIFLSIYQKPLENMQLDLDNLILKQETCITQMMLENKKLHNVKEDIELNDLFSTIETYKKKLISIKIEIALIHERTLKLKKRALKYQDIKQKEAQYKERIMEMQKE